MPTISIRRRTPPSPSQKVAALVSNNYCSLHCVVYHDREADEELHAVQAFINLCHHS